MSHPIGPPPEAVTCQPDPLNPKARETYHDIMTIIDQVKDHMWEGLVHYQDNHVHLGLRGQFADIWRKIWPLKRALWEGETLTREDPRQICMDLIGHLLLTIALIDQQAAEAARRRLDEIFRDDIAHAATFKMLPDVRGAAQDVTPQVEIETPWYSIKFKPGVSADFASRVIAHNETLVEEVQRATP